MGKPTVGLLGAADSTRGHLERQDRLPALHPPRPAARVVAALCGVPLLLWLPAVALTASPAFRDTHMPVPPHERAGDAAEPASVEQVAEGPALVPEASLAPADKKED